LTTPRSITRAAVTERRPHDDIPASYPREMLSWFACYTPNPENKLGHDAMLYLAEEGVCRLATIAYSLYLSTGAVPDDPAVGRLVGDKLTFGKWSLLLQACLPHIAVWDFSPLAGTLASCGELAVVRENLARLKDSRTVEPVVAAVRNSPPRRLSWPEAWRAIVEYRNQTLGHPEPEIVGAKNFYEYLTPIVAAAVAELLWNDTVVAAMEQFPIATFAGLVEQDRYRVRLHEPWERVHQITGQEGGGMRSGDRLVVRVAAGGPQFLALCADPERHAQPVPRPAPAGRAEAPSAQAVDADVRPTAAASPAATLATSYRHMHMVADRLTRPFAIGIHPVTQGEYETVTGKNPSRFRGGDLPVENVSWYDAIAFCNALSELAGLQAVYRINLPSVFTDLSRNGYRLPTEAEWEHCCLGGATKAPYGPPLESAWYVANADGRTHPVAALGANGLGLHDMLGNVWEWCNDWFRRNYLTSPFRLPDGPVDGKERVLRGGSWRDVEQCVSATYRNAATPSEREDTYGFRIACTLDFT